MDEQQIMNIIAVAGKIQHELVGSSASNICYVYITSGNEMMLIHANRAIYRVKLPIYDVHQDFAYRSDLMEYEENKDTKESHMINSLKDIGIGDIMMLDYCRSKYNEYIGSLDYKQKVVVDEDLNSNESFLELQSLKSTDGLRYFKVINGNICINIPYFVGLYKIRKSDKFGVIVYDFDTSHFLVRMINKKSKAEDVDILICILKGV